MQELKTGSTLQDGKYRIVRKLGQGGFGITYEGEQSGLNRRVAIKEFFMKDYCNRDDDTSHVTIGSEGSRDMVAEYRRKFLKEAQLIASMEDVPHIIRIYDIFEENETAYYVMAFVDGGSLKDLVKREGRLSEQQAVGYISQVGEALAKLHERNILHLDIKPDNVLLTPQGEAMLIDFGVSKHYDEKGSQTSSTPLGLSKGYAPTEQYQQGGMSQFSPATDVYSLAATLYNLLTAQVPPEANVIFEDGFPERPSYVSERLWQAIEQAMQPRRKDRTQTVGEFLRALDSDGEATVVTPEAVVVDEGEPTVVKPQAEAGDPTVLKQPQSRVEVAPPVVEDEEDDEEEESANRWKMPLIIGIILALVGGGLAWYFLSGSSKSSNDWDTELYDDDNDSTEAVTGATTLEADSVRAADNDDEEYVVYEEEPMSDEEIERIEREIRAPRNQEVGDVAVGRIEDMDDYDPVILEEPINIPEPQTEQSKVFEVVEQMPSFPGGDAALMSFIANNIRFPAVCEDIQGRVVCSFIVERDGSISDVKVVKGVDPALDQEAKRVLKSMPRWNPGKQNGQPVRVKYTVPVTFRVQ